jgi:transposase InsO family protein
LTVFGRRLLVERIELAWPIAHAAAMTGVSRQTATKWVRRYRADGLAGLEDRSSRPHRSPRRLAPEQVAAILAARQSSASGRIAWRRSSAACARRSATCCGAMACPACGIATGRRASRSAMSASGPVICSTSTSRSSAGSPTAVARRGYDFIHQAIDDMSRVAYVDMFADERGSTSARFLRDAAAWFARQGVRIERVMTDNARNYVDSRDFQAALVDLGARHKRTRFRRPQTNGKSERYNRTLLDEWAYVRPYASNDERLAALPAFVDHHNIHRPHTALKGLTPMAALVDNVSGNHIRRGLKPG